MGYEKEREGNSFVRCFTKARVLEWKRGPDWVKPWSMRILREVEEVGCGGAIVGLEDMRVDGWDRWG